LHGFAVLVGLVLLDSTLERLVIIEADNMLFLLEDVTVWNVEIEGPEEDEDPLRSRDLIDVGIVSGVGGFDVVGIGRPEPDIGIVEVVGVVRMNGVIIEADDFSVVRGEVLYSTTGFEVATTSGDLVVEIVEDAVQLLDERDLLEEVLFVI
jgi:hypothetical protein